ncbi:unnamed protein product [Orchesella dallaii]|uniref:Uncharacterized protein n=1 Tax=Orchesella dallaii TaxID=48710 RepID=A0ABP1QCV2_9HEXA
MAKTPNRIRRDAHFRSPHAYHLAVAAELDTSGNGLHRVRRVVSDAASHNEGYLDVAFSDDFEPPTTAEPIRFTHNDKEFEIVEQLNKGVQTDPAESSEGDEIMQRNVPRTKGFSNISKATATDPQRHPQPQQANNNKQQQTNHDLTERIELKRQKAVAVGNDESERHYYTRPVQENRSVGEQFGSMSRDNGVQACIYDMMYAEKCQQTFQNTKCTKKSTPTHQDQRIISECKLKTGISARFQPATSCNVICPPILPNEPSRGHLNICREDFRTLSRCAHLTWTDVIECTENRCTSSGSDENQDQCCRRVDNNYEPNLSDNCPVQRNYACRVPSARDKKSWFSWW